MHSILVPVIGSYTLVKLVELFSMIDNKIIRRPDIIMRTMMTISLMNRYKLGETDYRFFINAHAHFFVFY